MQSGLHSCFTCNAVRNVLTSALVVLPSGFYSCDSNLLPYYKRCQSWKEGRKDKGKSKGRERIARIILAPLAVFVSMVGVCIPLYRTR